MRNVPASVFLSGDGRYRHLPVLLFGAQERRKTESEFERVRDSMSFRPTPPGTASMKALRKARTLPPFLIRSF